LLKSTYSSAFGRLKAVSTNFLRKEQLLELVRLKDVSEIAQRLESTWYGPQIEAAANQFKPPELIEVALNRHLLEMNRLAMDVVPLFGKRTLLAYLSKWDIENIELIVAAKMAGRTLTETESFLVSSRNLPVGFGGNTIPYTELRTLLQLPDVEAICNYLVKYGYGAVLLQQLGEVRRTGDVGIFSGALQNYYYSKLLWEARFLKGDEGALREYFRAEISKRNLLNLLKSKESRIPREVFSKHLIEGGLIGTQAILEAFSSPDIGEVARRFEQWFDLSDAVKRYEKNRDLTEFEVSIDRLLVRSYMPRFRSLSLSLGSVFSFVLQVELERQNIRRIVYAKQYGMPEEYIRGILLLE